MILLELAFKPGQQGKGVGRSAGKAGQNSLVVKPANFLRVRFHDGFAERNLPVAGHSYMIVFANQQHRRTANT